MLTLLYDGGCAVCVREMRRAARLDRRGQLAFIDISVGAPDACLANAGLLNAATRGLQRAELLRLLHAVDADGHLLIGMPAVRALYGALGLGWLLAPTAWPGLRPLCDCLYATFARNRYVFGRCEDGQCVLPRAGRLS